MKLIFLGIGLVIGLLIHNPPKESPYVNYRMYKEGGTIVTFRMYDTIKIGTEFIINGDKYTVCGFEFGRNEDYPILKINKDGSFKIQFHE